MAKLNGKFHEQNISGSNMHQKLGANIKFCDEHNLVVGQAKVAPLVACWLAVDCRGVTQLGGLLPVL